jgi:hypothetical protein
MPLVVNNHIPAPSTQRLKKAKNVQESPSGLLAIISFPRVNEYSLYPFCQVVGCILGVVGLIAIGVGVGVGVSRHTSSTNTKSAAAGTSDNSAGVVSQSDPNDPSTFIKDPNLKQSFYGLAYTPAGSQLSQGCTANIADVITDIQVSTPNLCAKFCQAPMPIQFLVVDVSAHKENPHLWRGLQPECSRGMFCTSSAGNPFTDTGLQLEAIKQTKVDMQVYLGNYPIATDNGAAYTRQKNLILDALKTYGADHVAGITVGNEFILKYVPSSIVCGHVLIVSDLQLYHR